MADPLDIIHKLIALALNNPNEEEARSAAYRAVAMIQEHQVPLGGKTAPTRAVTLTPEEQGEFKDILTSLQRSGKNPDEFKPAFSYPTTDIDDEFMKKRIIEAWRQIREQRKQLDAEIRRFEAETHRKFSGTGFYG